ncbi:GntR family transcriptional regulator [Streptomyces sp. SID8367]|nr:GntR family transcriptional regulator [Streptomyces sp. SID8367]
MKGRDGNGGGGREVIRVADELRSRITEGRYPLNSMLPPQRALAEELSVSRDTIQRALAELASESWIAPRQGSGTRVIKTQRVQSYTLPGARAGRVTLRECFDEVFAGEEVVLDVFTFTSQSLDTQVKGQLERVRSGLVAPRRIIVRMLLPDESLDLPFPRALHDDNSADVNARLRERALDITHRHSESLALELRQLVAEGLVKSADLSIRHVPLVPVFKIYLMNRTQALHGPYEVKPRPIILSSSETVEALDVLGLGASLTHYARDENPDSRGSVFVVTWQRWFDSVWKYLAV